MRMRAAALLALMLLVLEGCGGIQVIGVVNGGPVYLWNAQIVQPSTNSIVLVPGTPLIVIVEFVPAGGVFLSGPQFVNAFNGANPNLAFCPSVVSVVNNGLYTAPSLFQYPAIALTLVPIGAGACSIPINVGQGGTLFLDVSVH